MSTAVAAPAEEPDRNDVLAQIANLLRQIGVLLMKSTPVSPRASRRHSEVATEGDRSTRNAGSLGLRNTDGGGTNVYPVRIQHFIGANVVEVDNAEVNILVGGAGANLPNDDGATLDYGAVVVATAAGLVTTTTAQDTRPVGVIQRSTSDTENAPAIFVGYVAQINTTGTVNADDFLETSTSAGLAQAFATRRVGSFAQALANGPNPPAIMWSPPDAVTGVPGGGGAGVVGSAYAAGTADQGLAADTMTDVTSCSISLAAGTWHIWGMAAVIEPTGGNYTLLVIADGSNTNLAESKALDQSANGQRTHNVQVRVTHGSTTTYKLRAQNGGATPTWKYAIDGFGSSENIMAIQVA